MPPVPMKQPPIMGEAAVPGCLDHQGNATGVPWYQWYLAIPSLAPLVCSCLFYSWYFIQLIVQSKFASGGECRCCSQWNIMKYHEISWNIIHEAPGCAWEPLGSLPSDFGFTVVSELGNGISGSFNGNVCASWCEWCADLCYCGSPRVVGVVAHLAVLLWQLHFDDGDNLVFVLVVHGCWAEWLEWLDGHSVQQRRQACRKFRWVRLLCSEWDEHCKLVIWLEL